MTAVEELLQKLLLPARLLYVEDDPQQAELLRVMIQRKYECSIDWAETGTAAKRKLDEGQYDLLLLDVVLPDVSAANILRYARRKWPQTPAVLVTGYPGSRAADEAAECGVVGLMVKPVSEADIDELFRLFKIRVRTKQATQYFNSLPVGVPA